FDGTYYHLTNAYCEPRPDPIPPILIGGGGEKRTLRIVANYADWWNIPGGTIETYAHKLSVLKQYCSEIGRDEVTIVKTWSPEAIAVAETEAEAQRIADGSPYNNSTAIIGTPQQVAAQLQPFADLGVEHFIVRLMDFPNTAGLDLFVHEVMPRLKG
ncbi:MAG: LLM class flavin-dependent oxidoreductase, partial [Roseiflexaceae bacterium]|nr:LLM class flavin-dependent oxidoreductase [Roseiflexaceae bacterium]